MFIRVEPDRREGAMKKKIWCGHIIQGPLAPDFMFLLNEQGYTSVRAKENWNFCPICATPRLKSKSVNPRFQIQRRNMGETAWRVLKSDNKKGATEEILDHLKNTHPFVIFRRVPTPTI